MLSRLRGSICGKLKIFENFSLSCQKMRFISISKGGVGGPPDFFELRYVGHITIRLVFAKDFGQIFYFHLKMAGRCFFDPPN